MPPKTAYVVSHTHWDREWYQTFHEFRVDLARVVRKVLDALEGDADFAHFVLDGQAVILEDYLEVHPEDRPRIQRLVEAGRLAVGPWYMLPDEFLVSAEAHVRNLIYGHKVAGAFGAVQPVGYMPDSFGHIAQMPQILRGAGIDSFVYTRGNGDEIDELGYEYRWRASDGSEVLAINQCGGYCNAAGLGLEEIWHAHTPREIDAERAVRKVGELLDKMAPLSRGDVVLLNNGCDHFPPQRELARLLAALREAFPETDFRHGSLAEYVEAVLKGGFAQATHEGELLGGKLHHILSGVWSARMPLKQRNDECQTLLARTLEPLAAYDRFIHGRDYPAGAIEYAWKLLLRNHPHDSICGCSIDEVHREMGPRFDGVSQTAERLLRRQLADLVPTFAPHAEDDRRTLLCVANPLPRRRDEVVERLVVLQPLGYDLDNLRLFDGGGRPVAFEIVERWFAERFWGVDYRFELQAEPALEKFRVYREKFGDRILKTAAEKDSSDCFLHVRFLAEDLPAVGHSCFELTDDRAAPASPVVAGPISLSGNRIENEWLAVELHEDGSFDLLDKQAGERFAGLNRLEDSEDIGDEYDYSPCPNPRRLTSDGLSGRVEAVGDGGLAGVLQARFTMAIPAEIAGDRSRRSERLVDCDIAVGLILRAATPWVEVELELDNRARDHRLRVGFPTGIVSEGLISDGHFEVRERPLDGPAGDDWVQPPPETRPQQDFSLVQDGTRGLALFNRGLPEIAADRGDEGKVTLWLTLLRAVGWLSRDDFPTRRCTNAGPTLHTPDAQCIGRHRFRYAVAPFSGDWLTAGVPQWSERYRTPVLTVQGVAAGAVPGGRGLVESSSPAVAVTAVKRHEARDTLVVRLCNLVSGNTREELKLGVGIAGAWRVDLLERRIAELDGAVGDSVVIDLGAHEIVTIELQLAASD